MNLVVMAAFKAQAAGFADCPVFWPNETITRPMDGQGNPAPFIWCELTTLRSTVLSMGEVGAHQIRDDGFLRAHIMVPYGTGIEPALTIADDFSALFRIATPNGLTGLQTLAPTPAEGGAQSDDGNYYGVSLSVPYFFLYQG